MFHKDPALQAKYPTHKIKYVLKPEWGKPGPALFIVEGHGCPENTKLIEPIQPPPVKPITQPITPISLIPGNQDSSSTYINDLELPKSFHAPDISFCFETVETIGNCKNNNCEN